MEKNVTIAIIGAGISGLAAAKTLIEGGVSDIIVLEAQSVPGGRISSLQVEEYFLELGAQWIHGEKNEVFTICKENDLLLSECSSEGEGLYLRENGEQIDDSIVKEVDDIIKDILESCESYVLNNSKDEMPQSIGHELAEKFDDYLKTCHSDTEEIKTLKKELFDWQIRYQVIDNCCSDLYNLSAKAWGFFKFCGGNDYLNFKNGYSSLITTLVDNLPKNTILYNTPVKRIDWTEKVEVKEKNGKDNNNEERKSKYNIKIVCKNGETFFSQHVIVTSSLGYLKSNYKTMFNPSLPNYLTNAIEYLDFGLIDKIFLIYEKAWWDSQVKGFQLVWSLSNSSQLKHWGRYVTGFDVIIKDKPILLGWVGGEGAKIVEQLSEIEVGRESTEILRKFTKNPRIPLPKRVIRSNWWCNEYIKGGYSHITTQCDEKEINCSNLAEPVYSNVYTSKRCFKKPTILLAGESAHKSHFSTVHGAYESGQSQAQVILEFLKTQNK